MILWDEFIHGLPVLVTGLAMVLIWTYLSYKDEVKKVNRYFCDEKCHGKKDNYTYKDLDALQVGHALEQRVSKIEYRLAKSIGNEEENGFLDGEVIITKDNK